jgi:L-iditol 2-dehydrogenase
MDHPSRSIVAQRAACVNPAPCEESRIRVHSAPMKAIQFRADIPRYALGLALGKFFPALLWSGLSCTYAAEVPEPRLPADDWVKLKTRYGGICGTDMGSIHLHTSPYYSALTSFPFTFGHENVGRVAQVGPRVRDWRVGDRVVAEPILWCRPRGFADLCEYCACGEINLCERHTEGQIAAGVLIGSCRDTGGSWGQYFVAHESQLYRVPDNVSDESALLVEPFAVGLHAALQNFPRDDETVLIYGAGIIGLLTLAALRALGSRARILVLARYPFQAEAARRLGASEIIAGHGDHHAAIAEHTGARWLKPIVGNHVMVGGVDRTFECVGSDASIDDALRLTRGGGCVVVVGVPGIPKGVDWTAIFAQELDVHGAYGYNHAEQFNSKTWRTFDLALELMQRRQVDLGWLVTHKFRLEEYARAFELLNRRGASKAIKAVFEFE